MRGEITLTTISETLLMSGDSIGAGRIVTVFGGSGFVGRYVVRALARDGWRVRIACRRPDLAFYLQPLGRPGQIVAVQANIRNPASIEAALVGAHAVVNLVGILAQSGAQKFATVQSQGARAIAQATKQAQIHNVVHMSALGANAHSSSIYTRSKAEGEQAILENCPSAVILRPSVIFGVEDEFFNRFGAMARFFPVIPIVGGDTKFQPIYVGDVAEAVARALSGKAKTGVTYELGGPEVKSFKSLIEYVLQITERKRKILNLGFWTGKIVAFLMQTFTKLSFGLFPKILRMTQDQVELLKVDNIVSDLAKSEGRTLLELNIQPQAFETIAPTYLYRYRKTGQYQAQRLGA